MITRRHKTLLFDQTRLILILSGFMTEKNLFERMASFMLYIDLLSTKSSSLNTAEKQRKTNRGRYYFKTKVLSAWTYKYVLSLLPPRAPMGVGPGGARRLTNCILLDKTSNFSCSLSVSVGLQSYFMSAQ